MAARPKQTVALTITSRCQVAVHQSAERHVIVSQSREAGQRGRHGQA
jgi:hypothetical protein